MAKATEKARQDSRKTETLRASVLSVFAISVFALFFPKSSGADEYHYTNILVGERPAGMGGAYTAISDDPTGLYYNPAGIVYAQGRKISASVNAYYSTQKIYKNVVGGNDWNRRTGSILPNFFGIIQPLGRGVLGFSYAVPDSIVEDQDETISSFSYYEPGFGQNINIDSFAINVNVEDVTYNFGPSYALKMSDSFAMGITLYLHYKKREFIQNQRTDVGSGTHPLSDTFSWSSLYQEGEEFGLKPLLGLQWSPASAKYSVGFTLSRTFLLNSQKGLQYSSASWDTVAGEYKFSRIDVSSKVKREYPLTAKLGFAYFPTNKLLLTSDFSYYSGTGEINDTVFVNGAESIMPIAGEKRALYNIALGTEYYFSRKLALRGGLYTNFSNTPDVSSGKSGQEEHIDIYGMSLSITMFTRGTSLTLGAVYNNGSGRAQVNGNDPYAIQDVAFQSYMFYIGTSYFF